MYFLRGCSSPLNLSDAVTLPSPPIFETRKSGSLKKLTASNDGLYFLTLYDHSLRLWCTKPFAALAEICQEKPTTEAKFITAAFHPNFLNLGLIVILTETTMEFFRVDHYLLDKENHHFRFGIGDNERNCCAGPGEGYGVPSPEFRLIDSKPLEFENICSMAAAGNGVYLVNLEGIMRIPWPTAKIAATRTVSLMQRSISSGSKNMPWSPVLAATSESNEGIAQAVPAGDFTKFKEMEFIRKDDYSATSSELLYDKISRNFALITANGSVYTIRPGSDDADPRVWLGQLVHVAEPSASNQNSATMAKINGKRGLIAIGTKCGSVMIYSLPNLSILGSEKNTKTGPIKTIPQPTRRLQHHRIAREVSTLAWSSDGKVLAIGRKGGRSGGFGLFSAFGRPLVDGTCEPDFAGDDEREAFFDGCSYLFWGMGDQVLHLHPSPPSDVSTLVKSTMAKPEAFLHSMPVSISVLSKNPILDNAKYAMFCMEDRILHYTASSGEASAAVDGESPDSICQHILLPTLYVSENWPIRYVAISTEGKNIAVAGRRGLAHYNGITHKWKSFLDQQQELSFLVQGGMAWHGQILVVGCLDLASEEFQLRFYPRELNLDNLNLLTVERLPARPLNLNLLGNGLSVFCEDNTVYHYGLHMSSENYVDVSLRQHLLLDCLAVGVERIESTCWLTIGRKAGVLVLEQGRLMLINPHKLATSASTGASGGGGGSAEASAIQYERRCLTEECDYFYINASPEGGITASVWAICSGEIKVWLLLARDEELFSSSELVILSECAPLACLSEKGLLFGCEQRASFSEALGATIFGLTSKSHLFLHDFIEHLLARDEDEALAYADFHQKHPYFGHALEILLHRVLDKEADKNLKEEEGALLPKVVRFLRRFPNFLEVIVRCARKSEVTVWGELFNVVGDPKQLFEQCLAAGELHTATAYLIVLQTMEPHTVNTEDSARLLERVIDARDFELCKEIVRFLSSISSSGIDLEELLASINTSDITDE